MMKIPFIQSISETNFNHFFIIEKLRSTDAVPTGIVTARVLKRGNIVSSISFVTRFFSFDAMSCLIVMKSGTFIMNFSHNKSFLFIFSTVLSVPFCSLHIDQ